MNAHVVPHGLVPAALKAPVRHEVAAGTSVAQGYEAVVGLVAQHPLGVLEVMHVQQSGPSTGSAVGAVLADPGIAPASPQRAPQELVIGPVEAALGVDQHGQSLRPSATIPQWRQVPPSLPGTGG